MKRDELRDALIKLAQGKGLSAGEIDHMARMAVQGECDPLPSEKRGEPFVFGQREAIFADADFYVVVANVPKPHAQVDLLVAWREYVNDLRSRSAIRASGRELSFMQRWRLFLNGYDWVRFWSVRHPEAQSRAAFAEALKQIDMTGRQVVDEANARLREAGNDGLGED